MKKLIILLSAFILAIGLTISCASKPTGTNRFSYSEEITDQLETYTDTNLTVKTNETENGSGESEAGGTSSGGGTDTGGTTSSDKVTVWIGQRSYEVDIAKLTDKDTASQLAQRYIDFVKGKKFYANLNWNITDYPSYRFGPNGPTTFRTPAGSGAEKEYAQFANGIRIVKIGNNDPRYYIAAIQFPDGDNTDFLLGLVTVTYDGVVSWYSISDNGKTFTALPRGYMQPNDYYEPNR